MGFSSRRYPAIFLSYTDTDGRVFLVPPHIRALITKPYRGQTFSKEMKAWLDKHFTEKAIYEPPADSSVIPSEDRIRTKLICVDDPDIQHIFTMKGAKINCVKLMDKYIASASISDELKLKVCALSKGVKSTEWKRNFDALQASPAGGHVAVFKAAERRVKQMRTDADEKAEQRQSVLDSRTVGTVSGCSVKLLPRLFYIDVRAAFFAC